MEMIQFPINEFLGHFSGDPFKVGEKLVESVAGEQIVEELVCKDTRSHEPYAAMQGVGCADQYILKFRGYRSQVQLLLRYSTTSGRLRSVLSRADQSLYGGDK